MGKRTPKQPGAINIKNKRANFEYSLTDKLVAGLALTGSEIKSLREGKASFQDAYCHFQGEEMFVKNLHISTYKQASINNHEPLRERKLLLTRAELKKFRKKSAEQGLSIIPTRLFINDRGLAKMEIGIGKGKKLHDKRESIKEKDLKREQQRTRLR